MLLVAEVYRVECIRLKRKKEKKETGVMCGQVIKRKLAWV